MFMKRKFTIVLGAIACMSLVGCGGDDDTSKYPEKAIQLVVPFGAGGDTDVNARLFAKYLGEELGVGVGVSNTSGAAGMLGAQQVIDSAADGYTTLWSHTEILIPYLSGTSDIQIYDMEVAGIGMLTDTTVLAVRSDAHMGVAAGELNR